VVHVLDHEEIELLEQVADAVEAKHYPQLPPANKVVFSDALIDSVKFFGLLIVVNMLAVVIYLLSTIMAPIVFWMVNGILLGREYFQLVAMRRLGRKAANELRKKYRFTIWMTGFLMAVPLSLPLINLFIPVMGVAVFTHIFHKLHKSG
jgi:CysZ protein